MWTRARAVALGLAALTLAACGNMHPGVAAMVDGRSISMKSFDDTAKIYCTLTVRAAAQQGIKDVSNAEVRRQAIGDMVAVVVARKVAAFRGVTPKPQLYELTASQRQQIAKAFPSDADAVVTAIQDSQESSAIAVALGEASTGEKRTAANESELARIGQAEIVKAFPAHHVHFAPRFGMNDKLKNVSPTGSLSVAGSTLDQPVDNELPTAQRCS